MKYLIFLQVIRVLKIFVNGRSMTNAKVYQGSLDDKKLEEHCSTTFWLFLLRAKRFTIVVHFLKKRCIIAFSVRNLIFLTKF